MAGPYQNIFATVLGRVHAALAAPTAAGALPALDASRVVFALQEHARLFPKSPVTL